MTRDNVKRNYQSSKIVGDGHTSERILLGQREIETIKLLSSEIGFKSSPKTMLLDLGCADRFLKPACENENWTYRGLDYSEVNFEIDPFPIKDCSVDFAVSLAVIEHLRDPENFISEVYRCLKPGGVIYLSTPNFRLDWKNFYNDPTHVRPYTPESLEQLLTLSGFSSVASFPGIRCKDISWYRGKRRFLRAFYMLPFRGDTTWPVPRFLKGHARSVFGLGIKPSS